jgi:hypothetical protein
MSSAAAAADVPEEFAALAEYSVDDFMSEAASDVEIFATTEGHGDVRAEEIRFLARDPQAHDRVMSRVARLPRRALRRLLRAAGFDPLALTCDHSAYKRTKYMSSGTFRLSAGPCTQTKTLQTTCSTRESL